MSCAFYSLFLWSVSTLLSSAMAQTNDSDFGDRIVGGVPAVPHEFPFFAYIQINVPGSRPNSCGGSLVGPNLVLTAAHCCYCNRQDVTFTVSLNVYNVTQATKAAVPDQCTDTFVTNQQQCHPGYVNANPPRPENDFCLLTLPARSSYTPIMLYDSTVRQFNPRLDTVNRLLTAVGFGIKDDLQPVVSSDLRKVNQPVADTSVCLQEYMNLQLGYTFNTSLVLCGDTSQKKSTCAGDSGGPLFTKVFVNFKPTFVLVGVTGLGTADCLRTDLDALYGRVDTPSFKNWLYGTVYPTTRFPTNRPTRLPTSAPTTRSPTGKPTRRPTLSPTNRPTRLPTGQPTPKIPPTLPTSRPTRSPTFRPTKKPTRSPTLRPTRVPTKTPTRKPTVTRAPTQAPTSRGPTFPSSCSI